MRNHTIAWLLTVGGLSVVGTLFWAIGLRGEEVLDFTVLFIAILLLWNVIARDLERDVK